MTVSSIYYTKISLRDSVLLEELDTFLSVNNPPSFYKAEFFILKLVLSENIAQPLMN